MWDKIPIGRLQPSDGGLPSGTRVARVGTVSFTRSGFARVRWDDGGTTDEWAADLSVITGSEDG